MNFRAPKAFIRVDIPDTAQHALVQQQSLDSRAPSANSAREFFLTHFQRIGAETGQLFGKQRFSQISNSAKAPRVGVAQFPPII